MSTSVPAESTTLLERQQSLADLGHRLDRVCATAAGQLVLVAGEAGVGKTALLRRFCEAHGRRTRILWGACEPLQTPRPLGPLADLAERVDGRLRELVAGAAKPYEVAGALLAELRDRAPSVVVLEDMHWADEATLDVLTAISRRIYSAPALAIASYRDDEHGRSDQLRLVLGEVVRGPGRVKLDPLSPAAVAELARPHGVDPEELYRRTGGNPFFVTEVLASGGEQLPDTVLDAVLARAARLSNAARSLLDAVAVVPGQIELWLLEALAGELIDHLDECLASGILTAVGANGVAFRHELARQAIDQALGPHRRAALHRVALAAVRAGSRDPARLAHHAEAASDRGAVLEFAPAAGERAASLGAHREAAAQFARVLRFGDGLDLSDRGALLERLSDERFVLAEHDDAIAAIREALECYRSLGDCRKQANALCTLARRLYCPGETSERTHIPVKEALELLAGEPPCRELARAYALMGAVSMNAENAEGSFEWGPRAVALAERLDEPDLLVYALNDLGTMEYLTEVSGGRERLERSLRMALELCLDEHAARAYIHLAWVATRRREYRRAEDYIQHGIEYCTERDLDIHRLYLFTRRAEMRLGEGRWDDAAESAAIVIDDTRSSPDALAPALAVLALVRARRAILTTPPRSLGRPR